MKRDDIWDRLPEYFAGLCSAEEVEAINRWVTDDASVKERVERERRLWELAARMVDPVPGADASRVIEQLKVRIAQEASNPHLAERTAPLTKREPESQRRSAERGRTVPLHVASAAENRASETDLDAEGARHGVRPESGFATRAMSAPGVLARYNLKSRPRRILRAATLLIGCGIGLWGAERGLNTILRRSATHIDYASSAGVKRTFTLPDGSLASLGPGSHLTYESGLLAPRTLHLNGEAFFVVHHDALRPFRVAVRHAMTQDVGTAFLIVEYPDDPKARVAVRDGQVAIRTSAGLDDPIFVRAGEAAVVDSTGGVAFGGDNLVADLLSRASGAIRLHESPLADVLHEASHWYGVDLRIGDSVVAKQRLTISIGSSPLPQFLSTVAAASHSRVEHRGSIVVFYAH